MSDMVEMRATFLALENREYQCQECLSKYRGRADGDEMTEKSRKNKFCQSDAGAPFVSYEREISFTRCPGNFFSFSVVQWMRAHSAYERGVLPFPGSFSEQPAKVIETFSLIESHRATVAEKQAARSRLEAKRQGARRGR